MFEQTFTATQKTRRERTIALALIAQTVVVTALGLVPLLQVESLGQMRETAILPPMRLATEVPTPRRETTARRSAELPRVFLRPTIAPLTSDSPRDVAIHEIGAPSPITGGAMSSGDNPFAVPGMDLHVVPPKRPAPEVKPAPPVRLTSTIAQSQLLYGPKPAYPQLAIVTRSEGTVKLQAIINREGKIENLHLMSGPALLVNAAMEAVRTWRYRPLLLNGEPVEVITEIDVIFNLQR